MNNGTTLYNEIETVEQHETFRRMLLLMLDDPQNSAEDHSFPTTLRAN